MINRIFNSVFFWIDDVFAGATGTGESHHRWGNGCKWSLGYMLVKEATRIVWPSDCKGSYR